MEQTNYNPEMHFREPKRQLPNSNTVLILGIISIVTSFCYGIIGIILGIIALVLSKKDLQLYRENPDLYDGYSNLNTGRICAIIGLSIGCVFFLLLILYVVFFASVFIPIMSNAAATAQ
ncbi:MAG TPA: CCC motif membrane protein [Flavobacterium sp.]|jgi:hypothetical protein